MKDIKVGFIGAGNMAAALMRGLLKSGASKPENIRTADVDAARTAHLGAELKITVSQNNAEVAAWADTIVLAIKPQVMTAALASINGIVTSDKLLVSVAAGITTRAIEQALSANARVVRAMPNTPALVGEGATAIAAGAHASEADMQLSAQLFSSVGLCCKVAESQLDAVTGLSGSGPAYVMLMIEALADGGVKTGLTRDVALTLAIQTVLGSAKLALATGEHPGVLKDRVASPGGTTMAGLHSLEKDSFRAALINAVEAATRRSKELGS